MAKQSQGRPKSTPDGQDAPATPIVRWKKELDLAQKAVREFQERGDRVVKRYRDERGEVDASRRRFNLLWSNVQTLAPALFSKPPKIAVSRRWNDADKVGRIASQILERGVDYELEKYDITATMKLAVMDRLLPGIACAWVRYEPHFRTVTPKAAAQPGAPPEPTQAPDSGQVTDKVEPYQEKSWECTPIDYVFWKDYLSSPARVWEEVRWVARRTWPSQKGLEKRFGAEIAAKVPLNAKPFGLDEKDSIGKELGRAEVWEVWDKETKRVFWMAVGCDEFLDERADPLEIEGFFPCPKPLFATMTSGTMIPVPDYVEYQDQAKELDDLTERIASLTKAVKMIGLYDKSNAELQRIFEDGVENRMIAVDRWQGFAEKGGLKGSVDFVPVQEMMEVLTALYGARAQVKSDVYEVTGMADIIRGASDPNETATAQALKGRYANMRLSELQTEVERFARDLVRIKAEIMAERYSPETLIQISGIMQLPEFSVPPKELTAPPQVPPNTPPEMQQQAMAMAQQQQQVALQQWQQQNMQLVQEAIALLKSEQYRDIRIDIETQSMVQIDQDAERQTRTAFLAAVTTFMQQGGALLQVAPQAAELIAEMLRFAVHAFPVGREMESVIDRFIEQMEGQGGGADPAQQQKQQAEKDKLQNAHIDVAEREVKVQAAEKMIPLKEELASTKIENQHLKNKAELQQMGEHIKGQVVKHVQGAQQQGQQDTQQGAAVLVDGQNAILARLDELAKALMAQPQPTVQ